MANELRGVSPSGTLYAHLLDNTGKRWNGSAFETYAAGNYSTYDITMTEQGNSQTYVGDFPSTITTAGAFDYYVYLQVGASPAEGDPVIVVGRYNWGGSAVTVGSAGAASGSEIRGVSTTATLYARIMNSVGQIWNGSAFEAYAAGSYSTYDLAMTEQGNSGLFTVDFPTAITSSGTYEFFVHAQAGGSPAEGDVVVNTGKIDWTGSAAIEPSIGGMSGANFRGYILRRGFKRTDKDTEIYEAMTDVVEEMRRRFRFDEAEIEATVTGLITTLGQFKMAIESNLGLLVGLVMEDSTTAVPLNQLTKDEYDEKYPDANVTSDRGYPRDFCVYGGQVYIGPIPDSVSYSYRMTYSVKAGTIISSTDSVPFTNLYRKVFAAGVLSQLYMDLEEFEKSAFFEAQFEKGFEQAKTRERANSGVSTFVMESTDC